MQDIWMQKGSSPSASRIELFLSGRPPKAIGGGLAKKMALRWLISPSIGNANRLHVHKGRRAAVGRPPGHVIRRLSRIKFGFAICGACPVRAHCTKTKRRSLSVRRYEAQFA